MALEPPTGITYGRPPSMRCSSTMRATTASSCPTANIGSTAGTKCTRASNKRSSSRLPSIAGDASVAVSTRSQPRPHRRAAAAVMRAWFDCTAPVVTTVVARSASASPMRNSSLRALLPPRPRPVRSSRLTRMRGQAARPPSASRSRTASSSGVGCRASGTRGRAARAEARASKVTGAANRRARLCHRAVLARSVGARQALDGQGRDRQ